MDLQPTILVTRSRSLDTLPEVVAAAARGHELAWAELHRRYDTMLRRILAGYRLSRPDLDDVLQETWVRLLRSIRRLEDPNAVGAWLCTTARREALRAMQRSTQEVLVDAPDPEQPDEALPEDAVSAAERVTAMRAAIDRLPVHQRTLMRILLDKPQASYEDVGRTLGMPVGSIGPTRMRAVKRLQRDAQLGDVVAVGA
jgi:RNA polymerase sigma factor (sigma-70 family)